MLRNNLIVAWRNLRRYRLYTAINVGGLAAAFAVAIIVGLHVYSALTWDRFHIKGEQIYQVCMTHPAGKGRAHTSMPGGLGPEMVATFPAVQRSVRTDDTSGLLIYGDQMIEARGQFADPNFFDLFSFPLIAGHLGTALDGPNSIVLSRRLAQRLFGSDDPMGQTLQLGDRGISGDFVVTGIAADVPYESSLKFDWVIPFVQREIQTGGRGGGKTYLQIADAAGVEAALAFDPDRYWEGSELVIVPLFDKRLHPQLSGGRAMKRVLYRNGFVACLVLLLACINYANLAAGMSLTRAHEVGVRKVV
ncbi:MAG: ABC transporter permease, partial [Gemmatimonadetes bacterium]|nr:ABC transporter permease [Gemmatimonadota bacterium]